MKKDIGDLRKHFIAGVERDICVLDGALKVSANKKISLVTLGFLNDKLRARNT